MTTMTKAKAKLNILPLADRVAIRPTEETQEMKGGLYIPDTAKEKPIQGEVIAVGPGRLEKGQRVPMELKVGDRVVDGKYTGSQVELDEEEISPRKEGPPRAQGAQRRHREEVREPDDHQRRRDGRQGDRARGSGGEHGRPDGEGGGDRSEERRV